jgi:hypothetical protein
MPPARVEREDPARVADRQHPRPLFDCPGHDGLGGFVLGLPDPPRVPGLDLPLPALVPPPPARSVLSWLGGAAGGGPRPRRGE